MNQIRIDFTRPAQTEITLGVAGENLATEIVVDCAGALETWPDALFSLIVRRADGIVYPAYPPTAPDEGGHVSFPITAMETAKSGWGYLEIRATQGEVLVKTKRIKTLVLSSLTDAPVPPQPDWVTELFAAWADGGGGVGPPGADGKSAYELVVEAGFVGTEAEWLESLRGKDGNTPVKGIDYNDGRDGKDAGHSGEVISNKSRKAMITFVDDDGFSTFVQKWESIIDAKHIPVCCAVITDNVGSPTFMTWEDHARLKAKGVETLSHARALLNEAQIVAMTDAQLEDQLMTSKATLEAHGLAGDVYVYPVGYHDARVRAAVRRHYRAALRVGTDGVACNTPPIETYAIRRSYLDTVTDMQFSYFKPFIDTAIAQKGWIVYMSHSERAEFNATVQGVIGEIIDYARANGVDIVTMSQGLDAIGNVVDAGDYVGRDAGASYYILDCNGVVWQKKDIDNTVGFSTLVSHFPIDVLTRTKISNNSSFPSGSPTGLLETWRDSVPALSHQMYYDASSPKIYRRNWVSPPGQWGPFTLIGPAV